MLISALVEYQSNYQWYIAQLRVLLYTESYKHPTNHMLLKALALIVLDLETFLKAMEVGLAANDVRTSFHYQVHGMHVYNIRRFIVAFI